MWDTVENSYRKNGYPIQQFHGKWPFIRILGIQEPASALFSVFNLIPHILMLRRMRESIPRETKTYFVWLGYCLVSINTWTWSTIFHTRDWDITEKVKQYETCFHLFILIEITFPNIYDYSYNY